MFKGLSKVNFKLVTTKPKMVLAVAFIITIIASVLATGLSLELNWVSLAPKGNEAVQEYQQIIEDFPSLSNIIVIAEGDDIEVLEEVVHKIETEVSKLDDYVVSVTSGIDQEFALSYGLLLASEEDAQLMMYLFADNNYDALYSMFAEMMHTEVEWSNLTNAEINYEKAAFRAFAEFLNASSDYLEGENAYDALETAFRGVITGPSLFTSENGKMAMVMIQPSFDMMDIVKLEPGVNGIEEIVNNINAEYDNVEIGVTGIHVVARDEMASIESDSSLTTIIAVVLILGILYFAFRAISAPILTFIPLVVGIIWAIGATMIIIGRLNMMTVFAAAMLVGLGIDYSIHMYSSYTERRAKGFEKILALEHAINISGPGILTGALTTAVAFLALNISKLELLRELGTVMGTGIICTLVSVFWILPSMIMLKKEKSKKIEKIRGEYKWIGHLANRVKKEKVAVIVLLLIATCFMGYQSQFVEFDLNLMNLEPEGLKSIALMEHMVEEYDMSADSFSLEVDNIKELYRLHEAYEKVDGVKEVASIASFIPRETVQVEQLENIKSIKEMLPPASTMQSFDKVTLMALTDYALEGAEVYNVFPEEIKKLMSAYDRFKLTLENTEQEEIDTLSEDYYKISENISEKLFEVSLLTPEQLPENYKKQYISEDGTQYLLTIYPDFEVWSNLDTELGIKFFDDIAEVSDRITGTPIFMKVLYESASDEMLMIGMILVVILFVILMLHFRHIKYAVFAFVPLLLTLVFTVGTMSLIDLKFNILNFLALLLIIGIGIDYGVHILHHYKEGERRIFNLFSSVGRAILLTTLTTLSGFGSLMFSSYRGVATLGAALFIGVSYAFIMTVLVLPLLLKNEIE